MPTKSPTTKPTTPRKPRAPKKTSEEKPVVAKVVHHKKAPEPEASAEVIAVTEKTPEVVEHKHAAPGRYVFATGRRKTSVANVRLFTGKGDSLVNKKPLNQYFNYSFYQEEIAKPFDLTGLGSSHYFVCSISGGGPHSQAVALRHGIAIALSKISDDVRKILKKNGMLTRDDRKKERKKPGLKRARRSPQWAKR